MLAPPWAGPLSTSTWCSMLLYLYCLDKTLRLSPTAVAIPARLRYRQDPPAAAQEDV